MKVGVTAAVMTTVVDGCITTDWAWVRMAFGSIRLLEVFLDTGH